MTTESFVKELVDYTGIPAEKWGSLSYMLYTWTAVAFTDNEELFIGFFEDGYHSPSCKHEIHLFSVDYKRGNIDPRKDIYEQEHRLHFPGHPALAYVTWIAQIR